MEANNIFSLWEKLENFSEHRKHFQSSGVRFLNSAHKMNPKMVIFNKKLFEKCVLCSELVHGLIISYHFNFAFQDCWDAEVLTSYGWIECVGNADRACYDLHQHYKMTNVKLVAEKTLSEPKIVQVIEAVPNKALIGKLFKSDGKQVIALRFIFIYLFRLWLDYKSWIRKRLKFLKRLWRKRGAFKIFLNNNKKSNFWRKIENLKYFFSTFDIAINDKIIELKPELVEIKKYEKTVHVDEIVPSVIEPSYGIGRILYAVLEHSFRQREGDEQRTVCAFHGIDLNETKGLKRS
jgi:hypothetical protein